MSDYKCQSFLWAHTDSNILILTLNIHLLNKWQSQSAMNRPPPPDPPKKIGATSHLIIERK